MEKMMVIVFGDEKKAYQASHALAELDGEGSIALHAEAVIKKSQQGDLSVIETANDLPVRTVGGTAIGSLIGVLGGPVGFGVGAAIGATAGLIGDLHVAGVDEEFLADVAKSLTPGKFAVVADVSEEWITPVDVRMEALGGVVFRKPKQQFEEEQRAREIAALREEIDQMKAEIKKADADRKAKLQAKLDELTRKLQEKIDQAKQRSGQLKNESDAKVKALVEKTKAADRQTIAAINGRIAEIQQRYQQTETTLRLAMAKQLRKAAAKLEKAG